MQKIKILLVLLGCGSMVVLLDSCNGGTGTSAVIPEPTIEPSPQPTPSPSPSPTNLLENYVNLLTYQPLKYPQLQDENLTQLQLSMTLTHVLAINSILVNYYSDSSCTNLMLGENISGSASLQPGSYITNSASNLSLCTAYSYNGMNGCVYAYNNTHSMKFIITDTLGQMISSTCLTNPQWFGERLGYYNLNSNWSRNCTTNYNCGFSQNYTMQLN